MNLRLKTNMDVEIKLNQLQNLLQVSSKAAVIRICISYSLKMKGDPRIVNGISCHYDIHHQDGADYNRFTIFGEDEFLYKALMEQSIKHSVNDEDFFPELTNAHIERGIIGLFGDVKLAKNRDRFLKDILH